MDDLTPLPNDPAARTSTGELKDQQTPPAQTTTTTSTNPNSETKTPEGTASPAPAAPEKYDFKPPEGVTFDAPTIERATAVFKDLGLSQAQADKLVAFQAERDLATRKSLSDLVDSTRATWRKEITDDPTIGPKVDEVRTNIGRALDKAEAAMPGIKKQFVEAMDLTGAGDKLAFAKVFNFLASAVNEGTHVSGSNPSAFGQAKPGSSDKPSPAAALFPNLPHS